MIGLFFVLFFVYALVAVCLLAAGAVEFGTALDDRDRRIASRLIRTAPVWPLWIFSRIMEALRWRDDRA